MKIRLVVIFLFVLAISGCSYNVPLRHELVIDKPPAVKNERILIVMSKEQAQKVISYSPQLGDTFVFKGGPALKSLIMNIFGQLYREVSYAESLGMANNDYDRAIEVALQGHEIVINIYRGNTVKLNIDYTIYNQKGEVIDKLPTNTSSKERYRGSDYVKTIIFGSVYNIGRQKAKVGAAWDTAAINSIGELIDRVTGQK